MKPPGERGQGRKGARPPDSAAEERAGGRRGWLTPRGSCPLPRRSNAPRFRAAPALCGPKPRPAGRALHRHPRPRRCCSVPEARLPSLASPLLPSLQPHVFPPWSCPAPGKARLWKADASLTRNTAFPCPRRNREGGGRRRWLSAEGMERGGQGALRHPRPAQAGPPGLGS